MIPGDATMVAQAAIVPHLSQRPVIHVLDANAPDADYIIAADGLSPWPADSVATLRTLLDDRARRGYTVIREQNGWIVLRSPAAASTN